MYKKRTLQLFYILASAPDEYRTSKELSEMVNVTDRTIKGDIRELSNLAYDLGARIISHKGKGYRLEIEDEEVFRYVFILSDDEPINVKVLDLDTVKKLIKISDRKEYEKELEELVVTNSDKKMIAKLAIKANIEEVEGYKKTAIENLIGYKF